ncbi:MAG: hypothetical protein M3552_06130, partial [Planctomycetota bacterium]|nr:hypothetical protein [Planctomycetota bacterium]
MRLSVTLSAWFLWGMSAVPAYPAPPASDESGQTLTGHEKLSALESTSAAIKSNYESIRTWRGTYRFTEKKFTAAGSVPAGLAKDATEAPAWRVGTGVVRFALDVERESLFTSYEETADANFISLATDQPIGTTGYRFHWESILTPEHWLNFDVNGHAAQIPGFLNVTGMTSKGGRLISREPASAARAHKTIGILVDPRTWFTDGSWTFPQELDLFSTALKGERTEKSRKWAEEKITV